MVTQLFNSRRRAFLIDNVLLQYININVNLKHIGAAIVAAIAISGTLTSCATHSISGHALPSSEPKDELTKWADPWQPSMPVPSIWGLVVHRIIDVKDEYTDNYLGVALLRSDEPCFALLSRKDDQGLMSGQMFSRHNDAFTAATDPLGKDAFTTWILMNGLECAAQATR